MNKEQKEIADYLICIKNPVSVKNIRNNTNLNSVSLIREELAQLKEDNLVNINLKINKRLSLVYLYTPTEKLQEKY